MTTCPKCGSGVVYRFNPDQTAAPSVYVYVCLRDGSHVFADPRTMPNDPIWARLSRRAS